MIDNSKADESDLITLADIEIEEKSKDDNSIMIGLE
jgi:hypothetical protein